jgi:predicted nucleic acid-binding protein
MTSGSAVFLVDTNVLVYVHDSREPDKQDRASLVIHTLGDQQTGAVSTQILGEFFYAVTRHRTFLLSAADAETVVTNYINSWWVYDVTPLSVMEAMRGVQRYGFPYWDAVVWATAKLNLVPYLLSENGNDGAVIEGVHYLNPFNPRFDPALLDAAGRPSP